jgi:FkbM family methyltransferase
MEEWQYKQIYALKKIIRPNWKYIDIGGARGEMLQFFSSHMSAGYVFEPNANNFNFLLNNFESNNITIIQKAVSNSCDNAQFWIHPTSTHEGNLLGHDTSYRPYPDTSYIDVECITLDSFLKDKPDIDLIKIDVEGSEWDIFDGAKNTLAHMNIVYQVEFHLDEDWHKKEILYKNNYSIYDLNFNKLSTTDKRPYQAILIKDSDDRFKHILEI